MHDDERARLASELKTRFARTAPAKTPVEIARERPMSFSAELLLAILAGRKTVTRRPARPQASTEPPVDVGDVLWVREAWARTADGFAYQRDGNARRFTPARFMPRDAARVFLRVTSVRRERLSAIDEAAAVDEGFAPSPLGNITARQAFLAAWDTFYGDGEFAAAHDPWVWAIGFSTANAT